ncbi:MAG: DUF4928 family protein [Candidatus Cloacimonetes bacterium]|nr:DUF4928 family protein [Candidatus Cloacimonadota bacterium]
MYKELSVFKEKHKINEKGSLSMVLQLTRSIKSMDYPLVMEDFRTPKKGQVKGLSGKKVSKILNEYGIVKELAKEGGRTSRGNMGKAEAYITLLNSISGRRDFSIHNIELWWIEQIKQYLTRNPFSLRYDPSKSVFTVVIDLFKQAKARQSENKGLTVLGSMLQHLVGAKLQLIVDSEIAYHGAAVADASTNRSSDFLIEDVAIHVTTSPTEKLIEKCIRNIEASQKPLIITLVDSVPHAKSLAEQLGVADRIEIFNAEQFIAGNVYELGKFSYSGRALTVKNIIEEYNRIVRQCETDLSLCIKYND